MALPLYANRPLGGEHSGGRTPAYVTAHGDKKSRREEIADFIAVIDAVDTPISNELNKVASSSEIYEWAMDKFEDPSTGMGTNKAGILGYMEDAEIDPTAPDSRTMAAGYSHQFYVDYAVTNWQRKTREVGIGDELAYQKFKAFIDLGRKFEYLTLFSQENVGGYNGTSEAKMSFIRKMHGLFGWLITTGEAPLSNSVIGGRTLPAEYSSTFWTGPGGGADMTSTEFYDNILEPYVLAGGDVSALVFFTSFKVKRVMSQWSMVYQGGGQAHPLNDRNVSASAATLYDHVDVFETDYGRVEVQPCRILSNSPTRTEFGALETTTVDPTKSMIGMDPSYLDMTVQEDYYTLRLARTGPQSREALWGHMGLRCHNPKALCGGIDLAS